MNKPTKPQGIVDRWAKKPLDYEPGARWQYSNTGYVVAGMIVEKVARRAADDNTSTGAYSRRSECTRVDQDDTNTPAFPAGYHRFALGPVRVASRRRAAGSMPPASCR